uniref:Uncharacterized protein n=1 Tax=Fagus sylvatica TaxID=28930 RepID=A0A2N9H227_FAGSY
MPRPPPSSPTPCRPPPPHVLQGFTQTTTTTTPFMAPYRASRFCSPNLSSTRHRMGFPDLVPLVTPPHHGTVGFLFCFLTLSFHGGWIDQVLGGWDFFGRNVEVKVDTVFEKMTEVLAVDGVGVEVAERVLIEK